MFLLVAALRSAPSDELEAPESLRPRAKSSTLSGAIWYHLWKSTTLCGARFRMGIKDKSQSVISEEDFKLLQAGNREVFKKVYDSYYALLRYICQKCGLATQTTDEITQDTFLKLFTKAKEIKSASQLKYWLATSCRNACIDQIRSQRKFVSDSEKSISASATLDTTSDSINREIEFKIASDFIEQVTNEPGGETFVLFYRDGKSIKEIATLNREATSTVTTRLTRMRRKFKDVLKKRIEDSRSIND